ncbi:MAG: methylated-DNA--[Fretibacterium sp.]|nr:methylated-DNA--[protein]-cysteine S-methyltransferase [Fretibacterium sp.]
MRYTQRYGSPLGEILLIADGEGLTGLYFEGRDGCHSCAEQEERTLPVFGRAARWLDAYFSGREPDFTPPLHITGTDFQMAVWRLLLQIPYGATTTYGELARRMAAQRGVARMAAQAVGGAVGSNAISIIIPCHRVVGAHGNLTGYGGGIDRKVKLLTLEKVDMARYYVPKKCLRNG